MHRLGGVYQCIDAGNDLVKSAFWLHSKDANREKVGSHSADRRPEGSLIGAPPFFLEALRSSRRKCPTFKTAVCKAMGPAALPGPLH